MPPVVSTPQMAVTASPVGRSRNQTWRPSGDQKGRTQQLPVVSRRLVGAEVAVGFGVIIVVGVSVGFGVDVGVLDGSWVGEEVFLGVRTSVAKLVAVTKGGKVLD